MWHINRRPQDQSSTWMMAENRRTTPDGNVTIPQCSLHFRPCLPTPYSPCPVSSSSLDVRFRRGVISLPTAVTAATRCSSSSNSQPLYSYKFQPRIADVSCLLSRRLCGLNDSVLFSDLINQVALSCPSKKACHRGFFPLYCCV